MTAAALTKPRGRTDHRGWLAEVARGVSFAQRQDALFRWVAATGGYVEGAVALLPALPPSPARTALVDALAAHLGVSARIGGASHPDFGRELRIRGISPTARLVVRFELEALADRGRERVATGRVLEGGTFSLWSPPPKPRASWWRCTALAVCASRAVLTSASSNAATPP